MGVEGKEIVEDLFDNEFLRFEEDEMWKRGGGRGGFLKCMYRGALKEGRQWKK